MLAGDRLAPGVVGGIGSEAMQHHAARLQEAGMDCRPRAWDHLAGHEREAFWEPSPKRYSIRPAPKSILKE